MTIRAAVKGRLARRHAHDVDAFVVEELPVYKDDIRLDIAIINGRIGGMEIKSLLDALDHLLRRIDTYGGGMDRMILMAV